MKKVGLLLLFVVTSVLNTVNAEEVNIYSYRQPFLIDPITEAFTKDTGIGVNIVYAKKGLAERLQREGKYSPADIVLTSDFYRLMELTDKGLTQAVSSDALNQQIPSQYRDAENNWFALTTRARVIYAAKDRVENAQALSYESLATADFKNRICVRSGKHPYNVFLVASMIAHNGVEQTKAWLEGVKANLARKPQANDRGQVKAIKEGLCDVSLGNSYYFGKMMQDDKQREWAEAVNIVFPNQADRGTHINISGIALTKYAPNKDAAVKLMEYLASDKAQGLYASLNMEYPVNPAVSPSDTVKSWGSYKADELPLADVVKNYSAAYKLIDEVRFDL